MPDQTAALAGILRRLQLLEDERSITKTLYAYAHCLDHRMAEPFVDLFTEDAEYQLVPWRSRPVYRGRSEIAEFAAGFESTPGTHKHLVVEPMIDISGDEARVVSYYCHVDDVGGQPRVGTYGRYHDLLVRCSDGKWRFKHRRIDRDATASGIV